MENSSQQKYTLITEKFKLHVSDSKLTIKSKGTEGFVTLRETTSEGRPYQELKKRDRLSGHGHPYPVQTHYGPKNLQQRVLVFTEPVN